MTEEAWTVLGLIRWSAGYLEGKGVEGPQARLDSEHLLAHALDVDRLQLYLQFERPLTPPELARYKPLLLRRATREPLQYILGRGAFRELDLRVDGRVLIPRPETEELVEVVLAWARERIGAPRQPRSNASRGGRVLPWSSDEADTAESGPRTSGDATRERVGGSPAGVAADLRRLTALDVGTGSGCIALSLALEGPFTRVVASDPSAEALELARENAREAGLAERVDFRQGGLFDAVPESTFDVVVSNPPYVGEEEAPGLQPEVREHEPAGALFAGHGGMAVLEPLVRRAAGWVAPRGLLALEIGQGQAERVSELVRATGAFEAPRTRRDLSGRPRIVTAVRNG